MFASKLKIVTSALVAVAAMIVAAPAGAADPASGAMKLQGAWVAKVIGTPGQWSYVVSPDASGRVASAHGTIDVGFTVGPPLGPADYTSPLLIEVKMTGPKTAVFNSIWYGLKKVNDAPVTAQVVYIGRNHGTLEFTGPGTASGTHTIEIYAPAQDADKDGMPDPNETPKSSVTVYTNDTRVPLLTD